MAFSHETTETEITDQGEMNVYQERKLFSINMRLLPLKLHFLLFAAGIASFSPYLPLHANQTGLSATAIGILYFTVPVVAVITKPFFGWLADKYRKEKLITIGMLFVSIVFYVVISFIPSIQKEQYALMEFNCEKNSAELKLTNSTCPVDTEIKVTCNLLCVQCKKNSTFDDCEIYAEYGRVNITFGEPNRFLNYSDVICSLNHTTRCKFICPCSKRCCRSSSEYQSTTFWMFMICFLFVGTGERVTRSLSDTICFDMLRDRIKDFGKHRLWSTLGSCGAPFLAGYLLDITRDGNMYNYSVAIYLSVSFMIADVLASYKLDLGKRDHVAKSTEICSDTLIFFSKLRHIVFTIAVCIGGMMHGFDLVYYNLFMQEIDASKLLVGISLAGGVIVEVPLLFFAGRVVKALGQFNSLALSLLCTSVRFLCLVNIYNPLWVLLPQIILRSSLEFFSVTKSSYAKCWAPRGTEATLQQMTGSIYGGAGVGLGYGLGGLAFDYYGSRKTYLITAIISAAGAILCFAFAQYIRLQSKETRKTETQQESTASIIVSHIKNKRDLTST